MQIRFQCNSCQRILEVDQQYAVRRARCPHCSTIVPVPADVPSSQETEVPSVAMDRVDQVGSPAGAEQRPADERRLETRQESSGNPFADYAQQAEAARAENPYASPATQPMIEPTVQEGILPTRVAGVELLLQATWRQLHANLAQCLLFAIVWIGLHIAISTAGAIIQTTAMFFDEVLGLVVYAVVEIAELLAAIWLQAGATVFCVAVVRRREQPIIELFKGTPYWLRMLGYNVFMYAVMAVGFLIGMLPGIIYWLVIGGGDFEWLAIGMTGGVMMLVIVGIYVVLNYALVPFFVVDRNEGVIRSLGWSRKCMRGNRLTLFAAMVLVSIVGLIVSLVTCFLGVLIVMPYVFLLPTMLYFAATGQRTLVPSVE